MEVHACTFDVAIWCSFLNTILEVGEEISFMRIYIPLLQGMPRKNNYVILTKKW